MSAKIDMLMQRDQRAVNAVESYGEGAFYFPNQEPQDQQAAVNFVDGQNQDQQAAVNYIGGQNYPQNRGFQQPAYGQNQASRFPQGQQSYQHPNYGQNRPFGQGLGQNGNQNANFNQGGYQQRQPFNSFQPQNQVQTGGSSVPAAQESKLEAMMQQLIQNQQKSATEINKKVDTIFQDMNNRWESLSAHVKKLETQVAQTAEAVQRPNGVLPGRGEHNPRKDHCNVVISAEDEVPDHVREVDEIERLLYGSELVKDEVQILAKADTQAVERVEKKVVQPVGVGATISPYEKLPYPKKVITKAQKKVICKFRKDLSDIGVKLPELNTMQEAYVQMMLIKDILDHKEEVAELLDVSTALIDRQVPPKSLPKLESPGKFTLSCSLGKITMNDALVDSGANVNVISMEMVKKLGIESMEPNTTSLMFGDSSSTTPTGLIKDFPLKIGGCTIPIDLTVVKMATTKRVPLVLGTPFLATVGACIDFSNKKVTLLNINKAVSYPIQSSTDAGYCGTITRENTSPEKEVKPYGEVVLWSHDGSKFVENDQRLKPHLAYTEPPGRKDDVSLGELTQS